MREIGAALEREGQERDRRPHEEGEREGGADLGPGATLVDQGQRRPSNASGGTHNPRDNAAR